MYYFDFLRRSAVFLIAGGLFFISAVVVWKTTLAQEIEIYVDGQKYSGLDEYRKKRLSASQYVPSKPQLNSGQPSVKDSPSDVESTPGGSGENVPLSEGSLTPPDSVPKTDSIKVDLKLLNPQTLNPSSQAYGDFLPAPGFRTSETSESLNTEMSPEVLTETQSSFTDRAQSSSALKNYAE